MKTYTMTSKEKNVLWLLMGIGIVSLILSYVLDDMPGKPRFWSNFLLNTLFFTGISVLALFFLGASLVAYGGWIAVFKRVLEALSLQIRIGIALFAIIVAGIYLDWHHLYLWAEEHIVKTDKIIKGKSGFLNPVVYTIATFGILGLWYYLAWSIRKLSLREDAEGSFGDFRFARKQMAFGAAAVALIGYLSTIAVWQWLMSLDPHWYSTLFVWYNGASWFVAMASLVTLIILYLRGRGYLCYFKADHLHDLGKYIFAISIFWTYLWFSQYMLIWYGNIGEETIYFKTRLNEYPILFYLNLLINFVIPFLVLMPNTTKRMKGTMWFIALLLLFGHWLDMYLMVKPGVLHAVHELGGMSHGGDGGHGSSHFVAGFTFPGLIEIGVFLGFLGLFLYGTLRELSKASLYPVHDPYLEESIHHHVV